MPLMVGKEMPASIAKPHGSPVAHQPPHPFPAEGVGSAASNADGEKPPTRITMMVSLQLVQFSPF